MNLEYQTGDTTPGKIFRVMRDGVWRTQDEIYEAIGRHGVLPSVSTAMSRLRRPENGGYVVPKRIRERIGTTTIYEYRISSGPGLLDPTFTKLVAPKLLRGAEAQRAFGGPRLGQGVATR